MMMLTMTIVVMIMMTVWSQASDDDDDDNDFSGDNDDGASDDNDSGGASDYEVGDDNCTCFSLSTVKCKCTGVCQGQHHAISKFERLQNVQTAYGCLLVQAR